MQPNRNRRIGILEEPIKVLLIGERWDEAAQVVKALSSERNFLFTNPLSQSDLTGIENAKNEIDPSVIMVGPGVDWSGIDSNLGQGRGKGVNQAYLACITHYNLEDGDLYENADDFLLVPCSPAEMELRIKRLALKSSLLTSSSQLRIGEVNLDRDTYQVTVGGKRVDLAWLEFQLLKFLMENVGKVFTREQLLARVWGVDSFGGTRTVDVHIRRLRNKIEIQGGAYFRTVKNVGYGMTHPY